MVLRQLARRERLGQRAISQTGERASPPALAPEHGSVNRVRMRGSSGSRCQGVALTPSLLCHGRRQCRSGTWPCWLRHPDIFVRKGGGWLGGWGVNQPPRGGSVRPACNGGSLGIVGPTIRKKSSARSGWTDKFCTPPSCAASVRIGPSTVGGHHEAHIAKRAVCRRRQGCGCRDDEPLFHERRVGRTAQL
jgi:hypothetical protein